MASSSPTPKRNPQALSNNEYWSVRRESKREGGHGGKRGGEKGRGEGN